MQHISASNLDMNERDPNKIHDEKIFAVDWSDVFAEPDPGVHSFNGVWKVSYYCFSYVRLFTYRLLAIFGICHACCYGCEYGCTACYMIWCVWPWLKLIQLQLLPIRRCCNICLECCVAPCVRAYSMLLWNIRVTIAKEEPGKTQEV